MIEVYVPSVGHQIQPPAKARTVFVVDVLWNGRRHTLERRYSEFHTLHKRLKKSCKVPDFPPKRLADWKCKVQERRRQGLEAYIQGVLWYNQDVPKELLDFLKLKHFQQSHETCSSESLADSAAEESRSQLTHRAVLGFYTDLYVFPPDTDALENAVIQGVLQGFYQQHKNRPKVKKTLPARTPPLVHKAQ
ncbi:sorting nexin-22 isoform X3 [Ascaphus truei]|uniref:sorting nexin-22 isoform X3 n=1 Tax=Ascaphus truei TaxID=8439 RepID=UPI003F5A6978